MAASFSNDDVITSLIFCSICITRFVPFIVFPFVSSQVLVLTVIGTLEDVIIPNVFNSVFLLTLRSYNWVIAFYLKCYSRIEYSLTLPESLLWAVHVCFNISNHTSVQFNIVVLTWNNLTPCTIVLPMSFYAHVFWLVSTCFRCKIFPLWLK